MFAACRMSLIEVLKKPFRENSLRDSWIILSLRLIVDVLQGQKGGGLKDRPVGLLVFYHFLGRLSRFSWKGADALA